MFFKQKKFEEAVLSGEYSNDDIEYSSYYQDSFKRLKKNKMAMVCAVIIFILVIVAVFAPVPVSYTHLDVYKRQYQNLIENALKYSLEGSRIFIDAFGDEKTVTTIIKNTSSYEMDFTEETITERFTRGDISRTTEGLSLIHIWDGCKFR